MTEPAAPAIATPIRTRARDAVRRAWTAAVASGVLPEAPVGDGSAALPDVEIERPANPDHGDFATNLALKLARPYRRPPLEIAGALAAAIQADADASGSGSPIATVDVAPPGFLNLRLTDAALEETVAGIVADPVSWGRVPPVWPRRVNVEFVSANPTGPLTIGNARGAFVGDLLCRILEAGGQTVTREYYFNDSGGQIDKLGASVLAIRRGETVPEDGYHGAYVADLARDVPDDVWASATAPGADGARILGSWAAGVVRAGIEASLGRLGVHFDVWTSEGSLHDDGWVERAIARLRESGHVFESDGAVWLRTTAHGDDKDRVLVRSNGEPTYLAADAGYLAEKFSRGFDHIIYIWGIDHAGYVTRTKAAAADQGIDPDHVQMILTGWVSLVRGSEVIAMSKRKGDVYLLDTLLDDLGVDASRWFFASRSANIDIDIDIELAKKQSSENPVYYVQYAHARIASIVRKAADAGLTPAAAIPGLLAGTPEAALARAIARFPEVVEDAVRAEETQGVTAYATELATQFHAFYRDAHVIDPAEPVRSAGRLALVSAARVTLANALGLLGISAPESM
ncbi:MAG TPA: arginine--tRNA ligase [Candidatus Limnocylindrales bacterium]|nr:arginine--tRNA ligase [Candidatus Limnocylindrales bacterium]